MVAILGLRRCGWCFEKRATLYFREFHTASSSASFPVFICTESMLLRRLLLTRSCASSSDSFSSTRLACLSHHFRVGLPLLLSPGILPSPCIHFLSVHIHILLLFSIHACMPIPLQPTFLHFLAYFAHLRCSFNSCIPHSSASWLHSCILAHLIHSSHTACIFHNFKCKGIGRDNFPGVRRRACSQWESDPSGVQTRLCCAQVNAIAVNK